MLNNYHEAEIEVMNRRNDDRLNSAIHFNLHGIVYIAHHRTIDDGRERVLNMCSRVRNAPIYLR